MSAYDNDSRVRIWGDAVGTFDGPDGIRYAAHPGHDHDPCRWVVGPASCADEVDRDDVKYRAWADSLPRFDSLDAAIASVLGEPQS